MQRRVQFFKQQIYDATEATFHFLSHDARPVCVERHIGDEVIIIPFAAFRKGDYPSSAKATLKNIFFALEIVRTPIMADNDK
jgi:hypothetical protein